MRTLVIYTMLTLLFAVPSRAAISEGIKALLVIGGHSYDTTEFHEAVQSFEGIDVETAFHPTALEILDSETVHDFDIVVFYDFIPARPEGDSIILLQLAENGIPMLFLHHSICNFQRWKGYGGLVGGKYIMPDFEEDTAIHSTYEHDLELKIEIVNRNHPVTRNMEDFTIHDEGYYNLQTVEGIEPLLITDHPRCHPVVGWVNRYGRSTSVYLMLGHDRKAYENPSFLQLVENSIHWLSNNH